MYNRPSPKVEKRRQRISEGDANRGIARIAKMSAASMGGENAQQVQLQDPDDEPEQPQLTILVALITLGVATALVAVCAEFMVSSSPSKFHRVLIGIG
jgi:Ca2+:H+ antiporter